MEFFDKLAENSFKHSPNGELVFYPNGTMGKGRLVPDEGTKRNLLHFQARSYKLCFFVLLPYAWFLGRPGNLKILTLVPVLFFFLYFFYQQHLLIRNLQKHELRLTFKEFFRERSKSLPNWYFWLLGISSAGTLLIAVLLPAICKKPIVDFLLPVLGLASFAILGLLLSIKMYRLKNLTCNSGRAPSSLPPLS